MKRKVLSIILVAMVVFGAVPYHSFAYTHPTTFGAPESLGVVFDAADNFGAFKDFNITVTVPSDLRAFIQASEDPNSSFNQEGNYNLFVNLQLDFKVDGGNWHYASDWDSSEKANNQDFSYGLAVGNSVYTASLLYYKDDYFETFFPSVTIPQNKSYFDTHTWHFRTRFVVSYSSSDGQKNVFSPWSQVVSYSNAVKEDPVKLINHAPVLKSIEMKTYANGEPYLAIQMEKPHVDVDKLSSISGNRVFVETWIKVGSSDWVNGDDTIYQESIYVDAVDFFKGVSDYSAAVYQIKLRYSFDQADYALGGKSGKIYSPYSNVLSEGMTGWSDAHNWAIPMLTEAKELGLIPSILEGQDFTKPITREEFAELGVLLYEKMTGKVAVAESPNPFKDTTNPQVLKAFKLSIALGMGEGKFEPKRPINREQCAVMLFSTLKAIAPNADYSIAGVKDFPDQKNISGWALAQVKYMAKKGIISGNSKGEFMPKGITDVQKAAGYGMATREQAIVMSLNSYKLNP